jgi:hypothetical protein
MLTIDRPVSIACLCAVAALFGLPTNAAAACTGSNPTWSSTPDRTSVATCISNAAAGATINVTAGSATWSSPVSLSKAVVLLGAGIGKTVITGNFTITGVAARVSGFTFRMNTYNTVEWAVGFRIDHNEFVYLSGSDFGILAYGNAATGVEGLIDNNTFRNCKVVYYGQAYGSDTGRHRWAEPLDLGTSHALYVEDNTFILTDGSYNNAIDGNLGSRVVVRFNQLQGQRFEQHSVQGDNQRAVRLWELYFNTMSNPGSRNYRPFFIRGGTGLIFHNTSDGKFITNTIDLDNARSSEGSIAGSIPNWGFCGGTSFVDGNTAGQQGWPCRDQIGRSTDGSLWNYGSPATGQASAPAYIWRNTQPGGEIPVVKSCESNDSRCTRQNTYHLVESRDYYTYRASFNGSVGVGEGPLGSRPSTCTVGAAYWATDQGEWNGRHSGPDGQLYKCITTNTWSLYYVPYGYPHPLQSGSGTALTPAAPGNLRIIR